MKGQSAVVAMVLILFVGERSASETYYVRVDGGSEMQCTGRTDAPYDGDGSGESCAWDHPFRALPPGGTPRLSGGDTLLIGPGAYAMGYGAPDPEAYCEEGSAFDCHVPPLPSGPDSEHPTRVLGRGWDGGCSDPPELWGTGRPWMVMNLRGSDHVVIGCFDITDHSGCVESHPSVPCAREEPPFGDWAATGIEAWESEDVLLFDLDVHGLANTGIHAGALRDWTLERVRITGNGWAGWNGDTDADVWTSSNAGEMVFREVEIAWNGCGEDYPGGEIDLGTCWGQTSGGYGDGFGTGHTGGDWTFESCRVHHNTSDGLDLLYLDDVAGATAPRFSIVNLISRDNAGNPLKVSGNGSVANALLVSSCSYFAGLPFFSAEGEGDNCRAGGNSFEVDFLQGGEVALTNATITGEGDVLINTNCREGQNCDGSERLRVRNTILLGQTDWFQPWESAAWYYGSFLEDGTLPRDPLELETSLLWNVKWGEASDPCVIETVACDDPPLVADGTVTSFDGHLRAESPAIDRGGLAGAPPWDLDGRVRDANPDIGAFEFRDPSEQGPPRPRITVRGADRPMALPAQVPVSVGVSLSAGRSHGTAADWWLVSWDGSRLSSYSLAEGWRPGVLAPVYQGPLFDLPAFEFVHETLSPGTYDYYFGVDTVADGALSPETLVFDSARVRVY